MKTQLLVKSSAYSPSRPQMRAEDSHNSSVAAPRPVALDITSSRLLAFRRLLRRPGIVRVIEAHNGLTGLIAEETSVEQDGIRKEFDAIWLSSLTDSIAKGKPDIGCVDFTSRLNTLNEILDVTTKPIIFDGDSGGHVEHFTLMVRTLERIGVSAVMIEDKVGLKKNSLLSHNVAQTQDSVTNFCSKISAGKAVQRTSNFCIIARIESFVLNKGVNDALARAEAYIRAGADAIMIHSKERTPRQILRFCWRYRRLKSKVPLVVVPTTYSQVTEKQLAKAGVQVVIYANHLLRSSYPAMLQAANAILSEGSAAGMSKFCMPVEDLLTLIPGST